MKDNANIPIAKSTPSKEDDEYVLPDPDATLGSSMPGLGDLVVPHGVQLTRRGRNAKGASNSLPVLNSEPHVHMTFRYKRVGTGGQYSVTVGDVASCIVAAASTSSYRYLMRTFRIKRVTLRGSSGLVGEDASIGLRFVGQNTNEIRIMDQTLKIDENAYVSRVPPKMSLASFWHDVESAELSTEVFSVNYFGTGEFYVDLAVEFLLDVDRYITYALSGGTALQTGGVYKGPLSGTDTDGLVAVGGVRLQ